MAETSGAAGLAALSVCEAILLSLVDDDVIDGSEARAILTHAAEAHRRAVPLAADGAAGDHATAAALIEAIRDGRNPAH